MVDGIKDNPVYMLLSAEIANVHERLDVILAEVKNGRKERHDEIEELRHVHAADVQQLHTRINRTRESTDADHKDVVRAINDLQGMITKLGAAPWRWAVVVLGSAGLGLIVQMIVKAIAGAS